MDAASILLILATAGQSGWTSEQSNTAPVTISAAPAGERYGATTTQQVQNWAQQTGQQQLDAAGNALREAGNRAATAVNNQLQQYTNPFATSTMPTTAANTNQPAATSVRGNLAPPPWDSSGLESGFTDDTPQTTATVTADPTRSAGMTPTRTDSGWTSIGPSVAAPPLLVPRLATNHPTIGPPPAQTPASVAATGPSFPTSSANREPITNAANSVSQPPPANSGNDFNSGWSDYRNSQPSIASNTQSQPFNNTVSAPTITAPNGSSNLLSLPDPPSAQQSVQSSQGRQSPPPIAGFRDPWAEESSFGQQQNVQSPPQLSPPAAPQRSNDGNLVVLGNRDNSPASQFPAATAPPVTITAGPPASSNNTLSVNRPLETEQLITKAGQNTQSPNKDASEKAGEEQPPWLPLLAVSLALAGSVSANFFLGWSYMDARQKYQSLVRKTADTFRRVAAAA